MQVFYRAFFFTRAHLAFLRLLLYPPVLFPGEFILHVCIDHYNRYIALFMPPVHGTAYNQLTELEREVAVPTTSNIFITTALFLILSISSAHQYHHLPDNPVPSEILREEGNILANSSHSLRWLSKGFRRKEVDKKRKEIRNLVSGNETRGSNFPPSIAFSLPSCAHRYTPCPSSSTNEYTSL